MLSLMLMRFTIVEIFPMNHPNCHCADNPRYAAPLNLGQQDGPGFNTGFQSTTAEPVACSAATANFSKQDAAVAAEVNLDEC